MTEPAPREEPAALDLAAADRLLHWIASSPHLDDDVGWSRPQMLAAARAFRDAFERCRAERDALREALRNVVGEHWHRGAAGVTQDKIDAARVALGEVTP